MVIPECHEMMRGNKTLSEAVLEVWNVQNLTECDTFPRAVRLVGFQSDHFETTTTFLPTFTNLAAHPSDRLAAT